MQIVQIGIPQFYQYLDPFRVWLHKKKKSRLEELDRTRATVLFQEFADRWNTGVLNPLFYKRGQLKRHYHALLHPYDWKFVLSPADEGRLAVIRQQVLRVNEQQPEAPRVEQKEEGEVGKEEAEYQAALLRRRNRDEPEVGPTQTTKEKKAALNKALNGPKSDSQEQDEFKAGLTLEQVKNRANKARAAIQNKVKKYEQEETKKMQRFLRTRYKE